MIEQAKVGWSFDKDADIMVQNIFRTKLLIISKISF